MSVFGVLGLWSLPGAAALVGCKPWCQRFPLPDLFSSCCIRFCQKAALEKLLISGRFMARCADCASVARLMIYNYICEVLMAPGVWFRETIKCSLASESLQEAKQADSGVLRSAEAEGHLPERGNWGHLTFLLAVVPITHQREKKLEPYCLVGESIDSAVTLLVLSDRLFRIYCVFCLSLYVFHTWLGRSVESKRQKHCWIASLVSNALSCVGLEGEGLGWLQRWQRCLLPSTWCAGCQLGASWGVKLHCGWAFAAAVSCGTSSLLVLEYKSSCN